MFNLYAISFKNVNKVAAEVEQDNIRQCAGYADKQESFVVLLFGGFGEFDAVVNERRYGNDSTDAHGKVGKEQGLSKVQNVQDLQGVLDDTGGSAENTAGIQNLGAEMAHSAGQCLDQWYCTQ